MLCIINSICFANYFDDNTDRFMPCVSTDQSKEYIDLDSIDVVRYDPPYYVIQVDTYILNSVNQLGKNFTSRYFYNYNTKNIDAQLNKFAKCDENGALSAEVTFEEGKQPFMTLKKTSHGYDTAKIVFSKAYNLPFVTANESSEHN